MRNRTILPLMEQICMIAVFALAAALCLQGFALANRISEDGQIKDKAVVAAQNAAEILKATSGDLEKASELYAGYCKGSNWYIPYDADWTPLTSFEDEVYVLQAFHTESGDPLLGTANICVLRENEIIFVLQIGWQEVNDDAE